MSGLQCLFASFFLSAIAMSLMVAGAMAGEGCFWRTAGWLQAVGFIVALVASGFAVRVFFYH